MDWVKARGGCPNLWQQVKKVAVTMAVLVAAAVLYLQFKKDYGLNDHINSELQRDYGVNSRLTDPEMLKDYRSFDRVYQNSNFDNVQRDDHGDNSTDNAALHRNHVDNAASNTTAAEPSSAQDEISKDADDGVDDGNPPMGVSIAPSPSAVEENRGSNVDENTARSFSTAKGPDTNDSMPIQQEDDSIQLDVVAAPSPSPSQFTKLFAESTVDSKDAMTNSSSAPSFSDINIHQDNPHSSYVKSQVPPWPLSKLELELFDAREAI